MSQQQAILVGGGQAEVGPARLLLGVFSVAAERSRRDVFRTTWMAEARQDGLLGLEDAPLSVRFVLGREDREALALEHEEHGDLSVLECAENLHKGKTFLWFKAALELSPAFDYMAKMDQDVLLWPRELAADMRGFARRGFYGGLPVNVFRMFFQEHRMQFVNGGLAILSRDLAEQVGRLPERARPFQTAEANASGFLLDSEELRAAEGIDFRSNEDVALGRVFMRQWAAGELRVNEGSGFSWALMTPTDHGPTGPLLGRPCPWRHASDLKSAEEYAAQWARRAEPGCRCVCPPETPDAVPKRKLPPDVVRRGGEGFPRSGRDMVRFPFHHKTDGVGGHAVSGTVAFGAAAMLGLRLVCDPAALYNGHLAQSEPHIGSELLLGCDAEGALLGADAAADAEPADGAAAAAARPFRVAARAEADGAAEERAASWADLLARLRARRAALAREPGLPPVVFRVPDAEPWHFFARCSPPRARFWPAAAALLRGRYHRAGAPEALAAPLWGAIGGAAHEACTRVTVQWRTAAWSLRSRGSTNTAGGWLRAVLDALAGGGGGGGGGGGCAKVALIAQMKEDVQSQHAVKAELDALLAELNGGGSAHAAAAFVTHSSKSAFEAATLGADDPQAFARDVALMATARLLFVGESQLSRLAAALQPADGAHAHVVADARFYADGEGDARCQLLPNTILADAALPRARLAAAEATARGGDPFALFIGGPSRLRRSLPVCTQYDAPAHVDALLGEHTECPDPPPESERRPLPRGDPAGRGKGRARPV